MCGLVGVMGNITQSDAKMLRLMMIFDTSRGEDGTGLALVPKKPEDGTLIAKEVGHPYRLFDTFDVFDNDGHLKEWYKYRVLMAHNRWATMGKVNAKNSHPFRQGHIIGAHNGTLKGVKHLEDGFKFEVDSEAIFHNINIKGVRDTIPNVDGAYALTWWDAKEERMHFIRNKDRPLYMARRADRDTIFWASESWMITIAAAKAGVKLDGDPVALETDKLYSFDLKDVYKNFLVFRDRNLWVEIEELKGYTPPVVAYTRPFPREWGDWWNANEPANRNRTASVGSANATKRISGTTDPKVIGGSMPREELRAIQGDTIYFEVDDECMGYSGLHYILARPSDGRDFEIRIFLDNNPELYKKLTTHVTEWSATMKNAVEYVRNNGIVERYATIDNRTIAEVLTKLDRAGENEPLEKEEEADGTSPLSSSSDRNFYGWNNNRLTEAEFMKASEDGCAWCSSCIIPEDNKKLSWLSPKECLCPVCACDGDVLEYVKLYSIGGGTVTNFSLQ